MEQMNALSIIKLMPENKNQIKTFTQPLIELAVNGDIDAHELDCRLKYGEETIKSIRENKEYKEAVIHSFNRHEKEKVEYLGLTASVIGKANFDYSGCNMWNNLKKEEAELKERIKKLETLMKTIASEIYDENGECITPAVQLPSTKYIMYK